MEPPPITSFLAPYNSIRTPTHKPAIKASLSGSKLLEFRIIILALTEKYIASFPGDADFPTNHALASDIVLLHNGTSMDVSTLRSIHSQLKYRLNIMDQTDRLRSMLALDIPAFSKLDVDIHMKIMEYKETANEGSFRYARKRVWEAKLLPKPSALLEQGEVWFEPYTYLAIGMAAWGRERIDRVLWSFLAEKEQAMEEEEGEEKEKRILPKGNRDKPNDFTKRLEKEEIAAALVKTDRMGRAVQPVRKSYREPIE